MKRIVCVLSLLLLVVIQSGSVRAESSQPFNPVTHAEFYDDFYGGYDPDMYTVKAGTVSDATPYENGAVLLTTGNSNGDWASIGHDTVNYRPDKDYFFEVCIETNDTTYQTVQIGIADWQLAGAQAPSISNGIYFERVDTGSTGDWRLYAELNGNKSFTQDVAIPAGAKVHLAFRISNTGGRVDFFINGFPAGSPITTNIPAGNVNLRLGAVVITNQAVSKSAYIDYFYTTGER